MILFLIRWLLSSQSPFILSEGDKTVADDPTLTAWTANNPTQSTLRTGQVIITKLDLQSQSGDNCTFSVEFEGVGKITKTKTIPA